MKPMTMRAWAGFVDGRLHIDADSYSMPVIYMRKKDARIFYEDVRRVTITIDKSNREPVRRQR